MKCNHCGAEVPDNSKFCNNCGREIQKVVEKQEVEEVDTNIIKKDYLSLRTFVINHKAWVYGYVVWVVIHTILWLFGNHYRDDKDFFFPFSGKAENYDFTEFFVYVIAIPILAYIAYYFYKKKEFKLPKITLKSFLLSVTLAFFLSLSVYAIAMKPVEHYKVEPRFNEMVYPKVFLGYDYYMDDSKAEIPSFLGNTYNYSPYKTVITYLDYPLFFSREVVSEYPKMPLLFRLRISLMIMLSWKGLRFFILMLLLSYWIIEYLTPKIKCYLPKKGNSYNTLPEANDNNI